jgi:pSer/pThr/pTyr-binding forkhead associated (FHA) protein
VGRDRDCAVRIDSATLSRHHARIVVTSGENMLEDLGSKNGTHVNGHRVDQRVALKDSDQIQFGSVTMTFRILETLPSTVTRRV